MRNITDIILTHAEQVLIPLVPDAVIVGDELVGRNPRRNGDSNPGSFKINLTSGIWADFATDDMRGGDVYSFIAHCMGTSKQAARKWAKQQVAGKDAVTAHEHEPETKCILPVPADASPRPGNPDRINGWSAEWEYRDQDDSLLFLVRRYDKGDEKKIVCWTYHDNGTWQPKKPPKPWPLYHLEYFVDDDLPLYLCEGEKAADAADRLLDGIGTCTLNGSQSVKDADLSPLHGRHLVIVPDADEPGRKYAQELIAGLQGKVKSLRLVDVWALGWNDGQDIADINGLPDSWDDNIRKAADWLGDTDIDSTAAAPKKSQATELVEMVEDLDFFHCDDVAYVALDIDEHRETWALRSKRFRDYLTRQFYVDKRKTPNSQAIEDALRTLSGKAYFECDCRDVYTRVGEHKNVIYLDMCNDKWQAIQVDSGGWRVVDEVPIRFIRRKGMHSLPAPVKDSKADLLFNYINVAGEDEKKLILAWLVQAMRPQGPYPVIVFQGEQGTAKTTAAKVLVNLIDPKVAPTRTRPRNEHDLLIAAQNGWIISLDNLSGVSVWLSDALCRLATGGGFSTRELFTDTDEILIDVKRPAVLNGIDDIAVRPDLIDRSIILTLAPIPEDQRKSESIFWHDFQHDSGKILGALLDGLSRAIRDEPITELPHLPRMADFAIWATAAEPAFGYQPGEFLKAFADKRKNAIKSGLDGNHLALVISEFMQPKDCWQGTMKGLLAELTPIAGEKIANSKYWPQTPRKLGSDLRRIATSFRAIGIDIHIDEHPRKDGIHVEITKEDNADTEDKGGIKPSQSSRRSPNAGKAPDFGHEGEHSEHDELKNQALSATPPSESTFSGCEGSEHCEQLKQSLSSVPHPVTGEAVPIRHIVDLSEAMDKLDVITATGEVLGADLETRPQAGHEDTRGAALSPNTGQARLLQLYDGQIALVIDLDQVPLKDITEYLTRCPLVFHNSDFDTAFLLAAGVDVNARCTQLETIALTAKNRPSLAWACEQYLGYQTDKEQQTSDWSGELTDSQIHYAALDAVLVHALHQKLQEKRVDKKISGYRLVQDCIGPIARARHHGVLLDIDRHQALVERWTAERDDAKERFLDIAGGIEPESPKQLAEWLADNLEAEDREAWPKTGKGQLSTGAETLKQFSHVPLVKPLLDYRHAGHRVKTWGTTYQRHLCADGRIRPGFQLLGARTGRMSSQRPNVQNLPRDPEFRACFKAPHGYQLVAADYSQIELRIPGVMSGDDVILSAYQAGDDLHRKIVSIVTGKPVSEVTSDERKLGKALNFGLLYGAGARTFQGYAQNNYGIEVSLEQAEQYKEQFDQTYRKLRFWQMENYNRHRTAGAFMTVGGRLCTFRDPTNCYTDSRNYPIQGAAADLQMQTIARVSNKVLGPNIHLVNFVHDELVLEVIADKVEEVASQLILVMTDAFMELFSRYSGVKEVTRGLVEVGIGSNYAEAKT